MALGRVSVLEVGPMQTEPPPFSWLHEVVIPILFTVFGAMLGFLASQVQDDRKAKRAKESFIRAVGMELDALSDQLDASYYEVKASVVRVKGGGSGPHFAASLRTSVFNGQIGKLRDVDDATMIAVIHFYSDIGTIEQVSKAANDFSAQYNQTTSDVQKSVARDRLLSALRVFEEQIEVFGERLRKLRAKLPPAEQPK